MIPASLHRALVRASGPESVIVEDDRLLVYESDGLTAHRHRPAAVVLPRTTEEVQEAVRAIAAHELPIVPRGAGTGLSGGAVALGGGVVIGTARMNRILEMDAANRRALLQPGVVNAHLSEAARPHGLYYAPDPSSQTACTIGGNVAENSGGPHCLKYGVTSRYVTGLKVVLADGSLVGLGGASRESPGYDLLGVFVGSEGCFGIATEVEVALLPLPEGVRTLLGIFDRLEDSGRAVSDIIGAGLLPAAMEIIDGETIRAVEDSVFAAGYPKDAEAALVIEFDGPEAGLDGEARRAAEFCQRAGAREVRTAGDDQERAALWRGRKKAFGAMGRIAPDLLVQDATVPRTALPRILKGISDIADRYRLTVANVFHAGDGNLHPNILFDRRDAQELLRVEAASKEIMQLCVDAEGTITGEHGVGLDKKDYMTLVYGDDEFAAMWGVRRAFDPAGTMNPGKVLPDHTAPPVEACGSRPGDSRPATKTLANSTSTQRDRAADVAAFLANVPATSVLSAEEAGPWLGTFAAEAVVAPESVDEVQSLMEWAGETGVRIMPSGAGSWLRAGGWAGDADVVLTTTRIAGVAHYEPADLTLRAGAGLSWASLVSRLDGHGQWLPLDPPGVLDGTVGGLVASGVSGSLRGHYGATRDAVLGLEVVTGDGRRLEVGGRVVKNVAGFDLVRLMTGSRGTLGVITGVSVRLFPKPSSDVTVFYAGTPDEAIEMSRVARTASVPLAAVELVSPSEGLLAVRILGGEDEVHDTRARLARLLGGPPLRVMEGEGSVAFHRERTRWEEDAAVVVRLSALPALLDQCLDVGRDLAATFSGDATAHVGQGVVRVRIPDLPETMAPELAASISSARSRLEGLGGGVMLSAAPASVARLVPPAGSIGDQEAVTARIKKLFDPVGTLGPRCP